MPVTQVLETEVPLGLQRGSGMFSSQLLEPCWAIEPQSGGCQEAILMLPLHEIAQEARTTSGSLMSSAAGGFHCKPQKQAGTWLT